MIVKGCVIFERTLLSRKKSHNLVWSCAIINIFYCVVRIYINKTREHRYCSTTLFSNVALYAFHEKIYQIWQKKVQNCVEITRNETKLGQNSKLCICPVYECMIYRLNIIVEEKVKFLDLLEFIPNFLTKKRNL